MQTPIGGNAEPEATEAVRAALKIAQDNYRRACVRHDKISATIEAAEARLARAQNDLEGYRNLDADTAPAARKKSPTQIFRGEQMTESTTISIG